MEGNGGLPEQMILHKSELDIYVCTPVSIGKSDQFDKVKLASDLKK